jgi:hypothetical protein
MLCCKHAASWSSVGELLSLAHMIDAERVEKSGAENMEGKCFFLEFILMLSYGALLLRSAQRTVSWGIL